MAEHVLILGASSDIALAVARCYAADGASLCLVARDDAPLARIAADLKARGANLVTSHAADLDHVEPESLRQWRDALGGLDTLLLAYGAMPEQGQLESDITQQEKMLHTNFVSAAGWLQLVAREMAKSGGGRIGVIGSVAGDRPRKPNYIYGASKSALAFFAEGLALRVAPLSVHVCVIKPGQTRTRMTEHLDTSGPLWTDAAQVGGDIHQALIRRRRTCYSPLRWRGIMAIIRLIPHAIFRRLNI